VSAISRIGEADCGRRGRASPVAAAVKACGSNTVRMKTCDCSRYSDGDTRSDVVRVWRESAWLPRAAIGCGILSTFVLTASTFPLHALHPLTFLDITPESPVYTLNVTVTSLCSSTHSLQFFKCGTL
jgi:hypothetical protein